MFPYQKTSINTFKFGECYTGEQFNKKAQDIKFIKILMRDMKHYNFQYTIDTVNVDTNQFCPEDTCRPGGLYFCDIRYFWNFLSYGEIIVDVKIPDDARVYVDKGKYKADKIFITNAQINVSMFPN